MKLRLATILLTAWYALLTIGIQVHMHYCGGELKHVGINTSCTEDSKNNQKEGCCQNDGCCSINDVFLVLDEEHKLPAENISFAVVNRMIAVVFPDVCVTTHTSLQELFQTDSGPPLFLLNCAFTFYG